MEAFQRLHPLLQRRLWDMQWTQLRPIQVKAIHHLLGNAGDCIISVPTAGGKTEAAFLPILSRLAEEPGEGIRAMYIGPLKALINDQFRRVEELCERLDVEVHKWHGDVGQNVRKQVVGRPRGVLLITPESLEAMFVLRPTKLPAIFGKLAYVVIDELHAFMGTERGAQLRSQLNRLRLRCGCDPVRIGLSATIADFDGACGWLRPDGPAATLLSDPTAEQGLKVGVRGVWRDAAPDDDDDAAEAAKVAALQQAAHLMLLAVRGSTTLAFANAKATIETLADALKEEARTLGVPDDVVVHHGSLSKELREDAEERLASGRPCIAVCSNTLELGIDVGTVDGVVQLSAPPSVAALVQRVGRSGRRTGTSKLRGYFIAERGTADTTIWEALQPDFLRGIATIELMREGFLEPIQYRAGHPSTLVQQLLSVLAERGGARASDVYDVLFGTRAFEPIAPTEFAEVLRALAREDLIEQMPQGDLILAPGGQRLVESYEFFAAFKSTEEVTVCHRGDRIGALPIDLVPMVGEYVLLGGRRWKVVGFDAAAKLLDVEPGSGRRPPIFKSARGDCHPRVHAKMRELATSTDVPNYLDDVAAEILASVRRAADGVARFTPTRRASGTSTLVFLWSGSKATRTLELALRCADIECHNWDYGLEVEAEVAELDEMLARLERTPPDALELAYAAAKLHGARTVGGEKYDGCLPDRVWGAHYAATRLDVGGPLFAAES